MERIPTTHNEEKREKQQDKAFLYHMVPDDMEGTMLRPLNALKEPHPDLYVKKAAKYVDRQHVMEQIIPTLETAWNDVLHFTAIRPDELKKALIEAGATPREMKFFQVDPTLLDPKLTTIYLYQDKSSEKKMDEESFAAYDPEKLHEYSELSEETKQYYKEMIEKGSNPLLFVGVPHILHKGSLDISNLDVITV
jgi:hypothetical protein